AHCEKTGSQEKDCSRNLHGRKRRRRIDLFRTLLGWQEIPVPDSGLGYGVRARRKAFEDLDSSLFQGTSERFDGRELLLLWYPLRHDLAAFLKHSVGPCATLRGDNFVVPAVDEFDGTIVLNRDPASADFLNHLPEVFPSRNAQGRAVVVGTMDAGNETETLNVDVSPFSWIVERHGVRVPGIKPADRAGADAGKDSTVLVSQLEKFIDAQAAPETHHQQGI